MHNLILCIGTTCYLVCQNFLLVLHCFLFAVTYLCTYQEISFSQRICLVRKILNEFELDFDLLFISPKFLGYQGELKLNETNSSQLVFSRTANFDVHYVVSFYLNYYLV